MNYECQEHYDYCMQHDEQEREEEYQEILESEWLTESERESSQG